MQHFSKIILCWFFHILWHFQRKLYYTLNMNLATFYYLGYCTYRSSWSSNRQFSNEYSAVEFICSCIHCNIFSSGWWSSFNSNLMNAVEKRLISLQWNQISSEGTHDELTYLSAEEVHSCARLHAVMHQLECNHPHSTHVDEMNRINRYCEHSDYMSLCILFMFYVFLMFWAIYIYIYILLFRVLLYKH